MRHPWRAATFWSGGCTLLFVAVYQGCTWMTSRRTDVGAFHFDWELSVPFVPALIIPYWSLDAFFIASFFLCRDRGELDCLGKRMASAILVAGGCFLLFPLRCVYPRPPVDGFFGMLFSILRGFDQPYNQFPSLHIALGTIVLGVFWRRTSGAGHLLLGPWFGLIFVSTVLTHQHHVIDVAGGFVLALVCFYVIRPDRSPVVRSVNLRVAAGYAAASSLALALMIITLPLGLGFAWPAVACALVAAAYLGVGPWVYGKQDSSTALSARVLLAPCLMGQHLSWLFYRRQSRPWDVIVPGIWVGRKLTDREASEAVLSGVTAVLDLTAEFPASTPFRRLAYMNLPLLDLTAPSLSQLRHAVWFIDKQVRRGIVYVHCKAGYSRSAAAVGAYLLASGRARTTEDALSLLRAARPSLVVRPEARDALIAFERERSGP